MSDLGWLGIALHVAHRRLHPAPPDTIDGVPMPRPGDFLDVSGATWIVTDVGSADRPACLTRVPWRTRGRR